MIDRRIHAIQIAEVHRDADLNIKFESEDKLFKPAKVHIPVRLVKYNNQEPIAEVEEQVTCPKCTML